MTTSIETKKGPGKYELYLQLHRVQSTLCSHSYVLAEVMHIDKHGQNTNGRDQIHMAAEYGRLGSVEVDGEVADLRTIWDKA